MLSSSSSGSEGPSGSGGARGRADTDFWAEVYVEEELRWISVDVVGGGVHCVAQIRVSRPTTTSVYYTIGNYSIDLVSRIIFVFCVCICIYHQRVVTPTHR